MTARFSRSFTALLLATAVCGFADRPALAQSRFNLSGKGQEDQSAARQNEAPSTSASRQDGIDMTESDSGEPEGTVRLTNYSTPWLRVLEKVAEGTGSVLIADRVPPGKYSRQDLRKYSRSDAVRILNQELALTEFKLLEKGKYLILVHLPTTRPDYRRPVLVPDQEQSHAQSQPSVERITPAGYRVPEPTVTTIQSGGNRADQPDNRGNGFQYDVQQSNYDNRPNGYQPANGPQDNYQQQGFPQGNQPRYSNNEFPSRPSATSQRGSNDIQSFNDRMQPRNQQSQAPIQNSQSRSLQPYQQERAPSSQYAQTERSTNREPSRFNSNAAPEPQKQIPRPMQRTNQSYNLVRPTGFFDEAAPKTGPQEPVAPPKQVSQVFRPMTKKALDLAQGLYEALGDRAEAVRDGADGLPEVRFYSATPKTPEDPPRRLLYTIGVDSNTNELHIRGPQDFVNSVSRLLKRMDVVAKPGDPATEIIGTNNDAAQIANQLKDAINKAAAANEGKPAPPPVPENVQVNRKDDQGLPLPDLINQVRSEVTIEAMEELGALIITGNLADVDAVMAIINQIELLSARTAPDIHLRLVENVNSEALAELLTTVYTSLNTARGRTAQQSPPISVIAVGRPNAVLILASTIDLESVNALIDELDMPIKPNTNFMVFPLKHTIATQVQTMLEAFYAERVGLDTRATIVADVRTNSIIVLARPNDLREIAKMIPEIDKQDSAAVAEVMVYELRHSAATELATSINTILQGALNPPTLGQGQLGQAALGFGGGNSTQQLRDVRSVVLEYLVGEGEAAFKVRSGILADIRISGDARSNTLVVTSPKESIPLITELVRRLDRPATAVATIKHFTLKQADATSVSTLLTDLFGSQTTAGNTPVGVQLAGAENASSIVPLRFSVDARTNSIVAVGTEEALGVVEALIFRLDATDIRNRETTIIRLKNSPAQDIADAVNAFLQAQSDLLQSQQALVSAFEIVEREVIMQAEPYTNSLLISATPRYFDQISELIAKLDVESPQVVIQVLIVEVTLDNTDEFGIELGIQDPVLFDRSLTAAGDLVTLTDTVTMSLTGQPQVVTTTQRIVSPGFPFNTPLLGNNTAANPASVGKQGLSNFGVGRTNNDLGFGGLVVSAGSDTVNILLRALSSRRNLEVLSRPQIRTLDNQPALIRVGQEVPRINGFTQGGIAGGNVPTVEQAEAGIILQVTPTISPDGNIRITVTAEKSQFDPNNGVVLISDPVNGNIISPVKDITQAETTVVVRDEQTIVLGGLITKSTDDIRRAVPWLSDIPIIGQAFQFNSKASKRTELLIFMTPRVVKGNAYNEMLKQIEASRLHYTEADAEEIHGPIFGIPADSMNDNSGYPLLPAPGAIQGEPLPLPGIDNGVPMGRLQNNSSMQQVNSSNQNVNDFDSRRDQSSSSASRFASARSNTQTNSLQQASYEQPAASSRVSYSVGETLRGNSTREASPISPGRASISSSERAYEAARLRQREAQLQQR